MRFIKSYVVAISLMVLAEAALLPCSVRSASAADALLSRADTVRNEQGELIGLDLRRQAIPSGSLQELQAFPKLRDIKLADTDISDDDLTLLGRLQSLESIDLRGCPISGTGLRGLNRLGHLKVLRLSGKNGKTQVVDEDLRQIAQHTNLRALLIDFVSVGDVGVAHLKDHRAIRELGLAGTRISDESLVLLAALPNLKTLRVANTEINGEGLKRFSENKKLRSFDVSGCRQLSDSAMQSLSAASQLVKLNLYDTPISDVGVRNLQKLKKLQWLNLDKTQISDASLEVIAGFSELEFLHLGSTSISDAGLAQLGNLKNLDTLIVTRTAVTPAGVESLQLQLPQATIKWK